MPVILRTHGGLGNQLFQVLYGRLYAELYTLDLIEIHDSNYKHAFPRSSVLRKGTKSPKPHHAFFSSLRIPKVLQRLTHMPETAMRLFGATYLDGYFQDAASYAIFKPEAMERHLQTLAVELSIGPTRFDHCLVHLRVGDFFESRDHARAHVVQRLSTVPPHSSIITNDEKLLAEPAIAALLDARKCSLISTAGFAAEEVLRLMASYRQLDANDSTLVFWASVLGGCQTELHNAELRATRDLFVAILGRKTQRAPR